MKISDLLRFSISSLFKRKFRTFLTVLGVIIGTISIVVMVSLGIGMKSSIMSSLDSFGEIKKIDVRINEYDQQNLDDKDKMFLDDSAVSFLEGIEHVDYVVPYFTMDAILVTGKYSSYVSLYGVSRQDMERLNLELKEGNFPTSNSELELVFGNMVITDLYETKSGRSLYYEMGTLPEVDLLNDTLFLYLDMDGYYSSGYTDENGNTKPAPKKNKVHGAGILAGELEEWNLYSYNVYCDKDILIKYLQKEFKNRPIPGQPLKKTGKPYKDLYYSSVGVYVDDISNVAEVQGIINDMGYQTYADAEWIESEMSTMNIIQMVLGGIGGVSLFVAAIGITNTMSMSIYERTKEIGIMKVIGCKIRDIQAMFLIEAGFIGFLGGVIGVLISYLLSMLMNRALVDFMGEMGVETLSIIPAWLSLAAIGFAIVIGMIAGFFPSVRAMRLSPLSAIRNE